VHNRFAIAPNRTRYDTKDDGKAWSFPKKFGAGKETRTLDLYLGKVSLYQLSYSRKNEVRIIELFFSMSIKFHKNIRNDKKFINTIVLPVSSAISNQSF
jgi:hypothetical protein